MENCYRGKCACATLFKLAPCVLRRLNCERNHRVGLSRKRQSVPEMGQCGGVLSQLVQMQFRSKVHRWSHLSVFEEWQTRCS